MQLPGAAPDRSIFHVPPTGCCARRARAGSRGVAAVTAAGTHLQSIEWIFIYVLSVAALGRSPLNVIMLSILIRVD